MRALIVEPGRVTPGLYRRFVRRLQVEGLIADHLVEGEPYLALNGIVLDAADHALLNRVASAFVAAFHRAGRAIAGEPGALQEIGFPWVAAELLRAEPPRVPLLGRFDFAQDTTGRWWLLEFNADTPSGLREAIVGGRAVAGLVGGAAALHRPSEQLGGVVARVFDRATAELAPGANVGIITTASALEDLSQTEFTRRLIAPALARRGVGVVVGDVDNVRAGRRGVAVSGVPVQALYRYAPFEALFGGATFAALYEAVARGTLTLLNGLYGLLLQNKAVLAWLWAHRDDPALPEGERAAIRDHLPPTWLIDAAPPDQPIDGLVAKQFFGREGEEVYFGDETPPGRWDQLRAERTYVVQRRIRIIEVRAVIPTSAGARPGVGQATVGPFVIDGEPVGYYTRFGGKVITSGAKWLATLVE